MDELRRAMLDAGAPRDEWQAELPFLIEAGQKRVRRRRMIATGVAAAVVTAIGTTAALAGVPGLNKSDPDPVKDRHSGVYVEERLPLAEVERRCNIMLDRRLGTAKREAWVAGVDANGRGVSAGVSSEPVENRVGRVVTLALAGEPVTGQFEPGGGPGGSGPTQAVCIIPQDEMMDVAGEPVDGAVPDPADAEAVAERCSHKAAYDLRGWKMLAATRMSGWLEAVFLSSNGYAVVCSMSEGRLRFYEDRLLDSDGEPIVPTDDSGPRDRDRYAGLTPVCAHASRQATNAPNQTNQAGSRPVVDCGGVGVIPGLPDGYRIEFDLPTGKSHVTTTTHGGFAYTFSIPEPRGLTRFPTRVLSKDGDVVWEGVTETGSDDDFTAGESQVDVYVPEFAGE